MKTFIGIDPGQKGGIALIHTLPVIDKVVVVAYKMPETEADLTELFSTITLKEDLHAYVEQVHSQPVQGVKSAFKFGYNYGILIGMLAAHKIPYTFVSPQRWQKAMQCMTKGDKNVSKRKAQELFPNTKVTHLIADALLIAEYGRRKHK